MYENYNDISYAESPFGTLNQYMTKTFGWMFAGLLVTFAVAIGAISTGLVYAFINSGVFFITCIAELILVGVLSARVTSLQPGTATGIFFAYAALNGLNLCSIFLIYDLAAWCWPSWWALSTSALWPCTVLPPTAAWSAGAPN